MQSIQTYARKFFLRKWLLLYLINWFERNLYHESRAFPRFRFNIHIAVHQLHQILYDGHSKTGSADSADSRILFPGKRLEDNINKFF